jgi:hypothetical protein
MLTAKSGVILFSGIYNESKKKREQERNQIEFVAVEAVESDG